MALGLGEGAHDAPDPKVAIPDPQMGHGGPQDQGHGQGLFAGGLGAQGGDQRQAAVGAETDDHAEEAPVSGAVLVGSRSKAFGEVAVRTHAHGGTIEQDDREPPPVQSPRATAQELGEVSEGLAHPAQGQALAGVAVGGGGAGAQTGGNSFAGSAQAVSPTSAGVFDDRIERGVQMEALPQKVPERDQGRPKAVVKTAAARRGARPGLAHGLGQETGEQRQELSDGNPRAQTLCR